MILVAGYVKYAPGAVAKLKPAMQKVLAATRAEAGCINYNFALDVGDPDKIIVFERWHDRAALDAHAASAHLAEWRKAASETGPAERAINIWTVDEGRTI